MDGTTGTGSRTRAPDSTTGGAWSDRSAAESRERWRDAWNVLRIGAALCFIGHGAFGLITREAWVPYFGLVGISPDVAYTLMPVVGTVDILVGLAALVRPSRVVFAYMAVWAVWTAALRPLTGEPLWELLERAGNYGVPLALLLMVRTPRTLGDWWRRLTTDDLRARIPRPALVALHATAVLLVLGHAGYGLEGRELLARHYAVLGLDATAVYVGGGLELGLATALAAGVSPLLLAFTAVWKIGTELLYPLAGHPVWEFVERSGSYAAPIALALILSRARSAEWRAGSARSPATPRPGLAATAVAVAAVAIPATAVASRDAGASLEIVADTVWDRMDGREIAADTVWDRMDGRELLAELRAGSLVLACRHAITDRSRGDARRVDLSDRSTQRNLSDRGERQARELGREMAELGIPVGRVLSSPYARTFESAELTFGRAEPSDALYGERSRSLRRPLFADATEGDGNRVLMTHQYVLLQVLRVFRPGQIEEGDCVVVRPVGGDGFHIAAHLSPGDWRALLGAGEGGADFAAAPGGWPDHVNGRQDARLVVSEPLLVSDPSSRMPVVEPHLAVDPRDPNRMIAGAIVVDSAAAGPAGGSHISIYDSDDGGATWRSRSLDMLMGADPWLTIDGGGNAYLSYLGRFDHDGDEMELWIQHSRDAGRTWGTPRSLGPGHDRETMVSGVVGGRQVTFLSSSLTRRISDRATLAYVYVARAEDGGDLEPWVEILPNNLQSNTLWMASTPRGSIVVTLLDYATGSFELLASRRAWVLVLEPGSASFSEPRFVAEGIAPRTAFVVAADPSGRYAEERIYALWPARRSDELSELRLSRSDDLGSTWSEARAAVTPADGARPAGRAGLTVDAEGVVYLAWMDSRHGQDERRVDLYAAASVDGGETFLPAIRVTPATSDNATAANGRVAEVWGQGGHYFGLAPLPDGGAQLLWADSRTGLYRLYTARLTVDRAPGAGGRAGS